MTEIYGTLGPACADRDTLIRMFENGMTGIRLNLSHTGLVKAKDMLEAYRSAAEEAGVKADLLIDMQGPELRIKEMEQPLILKEADTVILKEEVPVPDIVFPVLEEGDVILLDDGKIELKYITDKKAAVIRGGTLTSRKSIKIKDKEVRGEVLTEQDIDNLRHAREYCVSGVMCPFVRSGGDLRFVRTVLDSLDLEDVRIFAKIESMSAFPQLDDIINEADMTIIARGDLGNDMPLWELPGVQKQISDRCRALHKPYMVVTQMLASMVSSPAPTRAEVSDIFHAVYYGASAVMVTNETAVGQYPAEVIKYLANTAREAEQYRQ